jgi:hypothetical protein
MISFGQWLRNHKKQESDVLRLEMNAIHYADAPKKQCFRNVMLDVGNKLIEIKVSDN